jgi:hypothetical protein
MSDHQAIARRDEREPVPLKTVTTVLSHAEADLIVGLLQTTGIPAFTSSDDAGGAYPGLGFTGVRVMVAEADAEQATSVLEQTTGEAPG